MNEARTRFSYLAWAVLVFTVLVVLGGAIVRIAYVLFSASLLGESAAAAHPAVGRT